MSSAMMRQFLCAIYMQMIILNGFYAFRYNYKGIQVVRRGGKLSMKVNDNLTIMVNGLPGLMALETAKACIDRGLDLVDIGFTGPGDVNEIVVQGKDKSKTVKLNKGPGIAQNANDVLKSLKEQYPNLIVIDYTHPSAVINNLDCYTGNNCDFIMGTTGVEKEKIDEIFKTGSNYAVIAPNMAKQIVAVQAGILAMAKRFPGSFKDYTLTVTESHQSSKADTSGTAKAIVSHLAQLNGADFNVENILKIRQKDEQLAFGVPNDALGGHAFHTYTLSSSDNSVLFELKHNVCGRRIYAEGTVDAVQFLHSIRLNRPDKRMYNMIDVLENGQMS